MLTLAFNIQPAKASGTIYIRADGSVEGTDKIVTADNITYTFIGDVADSIVVERNNTIIDGNGYTVQWTEYPYGNIGLYLSGRNNVTIKNVSITGFENGIYLDSSSGNIIANNTITNSEEPAVNLRNSSGNMIIGNNITGNRVWGVLLKENSSDNTIISNNVVNNIYGIGIELRDSSDNTLRENILVGNSFAVSGDSISDFIQDIDTSNMMDGKPIYYWVNQQNEQIPPNAGYVALINCTNITVKGLTLERYGEITLWWTKNSRISNVSASRGIYLHYSINNTVIANALVYGGVTLYYSSGNIIGGNEISSSCIRLDYSTYNMISGNKIIDSPQEGIFIWMGSSNNTVTGNTVINSSSGYGSVFIDSSGNIIANNNIINNKVSMCLQSSNNKIYHNNFINNTNPMWYIHRENIWDDGYPSGGNYWSDYPGIDIYGGPYQNLTGSDGIGDTSYTGWNLEDNYPLMAPINIFDAGIWDKIEYYVDVVSNSTISDFYFNPDEGAFLRFNVTGDDGTGGFCRVTIPKDLLWVKDGWIITVGDQLITDYTLIPNGNSAYLYFTYNHSTQTVIIQGTHVIPEFPSAIIMPLFMVLFIVAVIFAKRKASRKPKT
jgi:parallel beta-helix repeat protein